MLANRCFAQVNHVLFPRSSLNFLFMYYGTATYSHYINRVQMRGQIQTIPVTRCRQRGQVGFLILCLSFLTTFCTPRAVHLVLSQKCTILMGMVKMVALSIARLVDLCMLYLSIYLQHTNYNNTSASYAYIHTYIHTYIHIYTHTYIYIYIYIRRE